MSEEIKDTRSDLYYNFGKNYLNSSIKGEVNRQISSTRQEALDKIEGIISSMGSFAEQVASCRKARAFRSFWGALFKTVFGIAFAVAFLVGVPIAVRSIDQINAQLANTGTTIDQVNSMIAETDATIKDLQDQIAQADDMIMTTLSETNGQIAATDKMVCEVIAVGSDVAGEVMTQAADITEQVVPVVNEAIAPVGTIDITPYTQGIKDAQQATAAVAESIPQVEASITATGEVVDALGDVLVVVDQAVADNTKMLVDVIDSATATIPMDDINATIDMTSSSIAGASSAAGMAADVMGTVSEQTAATTDYLVNQANTTSDAVAAGLDASVDAVQGTVDSLTETIESFVGN